MSAPGAIKEKEKECMDTDSPIGPAAIDHGDKPLPAVPEEFEESREIGDRSESIPAALATESDTKANPPIDAMDVDIGG